MGAGGLAFVPETNTMYRAQLKPQALSTINLDDASMNLVGSLGAAVRYGPAYASGVGMFGIDLNLDLYRIDPATGGTDLVGDLGISQSPQLVGGLVFVPELGTGLFLVASVFLARRR